MSDRPAPIVCERCDTAEAVIHLTTIGDRGGVRQQYYCAACATALGVDVTVAPPPPRKRRDAP